MGRKPLFVIPTEGKTAEQIKAEAAEALSAWQAQQQQPEPEPDAE